MSYSPEEQRVSDYIQEITKGMIGSGDDPIGFLIASHRMLSEISKADQMLYDSLNEVGSVPPKA